MDESLVELVWDRARGRCEYCQLPQILSMWTFEIDHIIAKKHAGRTVASNLALACFYCNNGKGPNIAGVDPLTRRIVTLFHPRRNKWITHFEWDGLLLMGLTPKGRATIAVLNINDSEAVKFRESLRDEDLFPFE